MPSTVYTGLGAKLSRAGTEIAYLTEVGGVSLQQAAIDVTNMQSPNDAQEFIGGLLSVGSITAHGFFKPGDTSGQVGLRDDLVAHTLQSFTLTYESDAATTWTFSALVEEFTIAGVNTNNAVEFNVSLKVSGLPTLGITTSGGLTVLSGADSAAGALDFIPNFSSGTYLYAVPVATGITYIKLTPTAAGHTITITSGSASQVVPSGTESAQITLGAAQSVTEVKITAVETGKAPKEYTLYVNRV